MLQGAYAPGFRQYVNESSPKKEPEPPRIQEVKDLDSPLPLLIPELEVVSSPVNTLELIVIDSSPSHEGRVLALLLVFIILLNNYFCN